MRGASDSPDLQDCVRDRFRARSDRARVPVCSQVLLLGLAEEKGIVMKNLKTMLVAVVAALVLTAPAWASPKTVTLNVSGMTCEACPITVKKALQKVPGVSKIDVLYEKKQVVVTFWMIQKRTPTRL
jgi:periplasmic mercuric ion binding protein